MTLGREKKDARGANTSLGSQHSQGSATSWGKSTSSRSKAPRTNPVEDSPQEKVGFTLRVLYLFAGEERKTSVASYLGALAEKKRWRLEIEEVDIRRNPQQDLSATKFQDKIIARIASGEFHAGLCTPPCSTWTRVRMANMRGPPPLRSREYLWGFSWVSNRHKHQLELGNELVRFAARVWAAAANTGADLRMA